MYAFATVLNELCDGAVGRCGLQQLQLCLSNLQERCAYLLVLYGLNVVTLESQYLLIIRKGLLNALYSNAQMFYS